MEKYTHSQVDSELLITTIRKYDSIWNKNTKEYHKMTKREAAWNHVCREIVPDWDELAEENKILKLVELKKRWNNIRDYYKKDLTLQQSPGQSSTKRKKYVFSKKLEFLRPFYGKISPNEVQSDEEQETEEYYEVKFNSDTDQSDDESVPLAKKQKTASVEGTSSYFKSEEEKEVEDDSDFLFLKSLVPDMKALNRRQKIEFKLGILQLYKHIISQRTDAMDPFLDENEDRKFHLE